MSNRLYTVQWTFLLVLPESSYKSWHAGYDGPGPRYIINFTLCTNCTWRIDSKKCVVSVSNFGYFQPLTMLLIRQNQMSKQIKSRKFSGSAPRLLCLSFKILQELVKKKFFWIRVCVCVCVFVLVQLNCKLQAGLPALLTIFIWPWRSLLFAAISMFSRCWLHCCRTNRD